MVGKTHIAAGLAAGVGICIAKNIGLAPGVLFIAEAGLGALLPDIDQRNSTINKATKPVGVVVNAVAGHRTIFHDPTLYMALGVVAWLLASPQYMGYVVPLLVGIATHLFLDALNPPGIPVLGFRLHLCNIHTGSSGDLFLGVLLRLAAEAGGLFWFGRHIYGLFAV